MAENENPQADGENNAENIISQTQELLSYSDGLQESLSRNRDIFNELGEIKLADSLGGGMEKVKRYSKDAHDAMRNLGLTAKDISKIKIDDFAEKLAPKKSVQMAFDGIVGSSIAAFKDMEKQAQNFGEGASAVFGMVGATANRSMRESIGGIKIPGMMQSFDDLQSKTMELQKALGQAGASFSRFNSFGQEIGGTFNDAASRFSSFKQNVADVMIDTRSSMDEVVKASSGLSKAFGDNFMAPLSNLSESMDVTNGKLNLMNSTMLISKATGMDQSSVIENLSSMHIDLGASAEEAVRGFGHLKEAARGSGLSFESVSSSIMGAAKNLKFYGTTVDSITPTFKSFNSILSDMGREGLTGEMFKSFTDGLQNMDFGKRALTGMSMPGGSSGGAIGAGLKVEQALETGEGMEDVIKGFIGSIKQFGGDLLTREDALKDPSSQNRYMLQRQFLGQQLGIQDAGQQDKMLAIMRGIEERGFDSGGDEEQSLRDLLGSGKDVADKTITAIEKASNAEEAAIVTLGDRVVSTLNNVFRGGIVQGGSQTIQKSADDLARGKDLSSVLKDAMPKLPDIKDEQLRVLGNIKGGDTSESTMKQYNSLRTLHSATSAKDNFLKDLGDSIKSMSGISDDKRQSLLKELVETGTLSKGSRTGAVADTWNEVKNKSLSKIDGRMGFVSEAISKFEKPIIDDGSKESEEAKKNRDRHLRIAQQEMKELNEAKSSVEKSIIGGDAASNSRNLSNDQQREFRKRQMERSKSIYGQDSSMADSILPPETRWRKGDLQKDNIKDMGQKQTPTASYLAKSYPAKESAVVNNYSDKKLQSINQNGFEAVRSAFSSMRLVLEKNLSPVTPNQAQAVSANSNIDAGSTAQGAQKQTSSEVTIPLNFSITQDGAISLVTNEKLSIVVKDLLDDSDKGPIARLINSTAAKNN